MIDSCILCRTIPQAAPHSEALKTVQSGAKSPDDGWAEAVSKAMQIAKCQGRAPRLTERRGAGSYAMMDAVISVELARELRAAGVRWDPQPGDRFVVDEPEMAEHLFWVSDFTIDVHRYGDQRVLGFNGTTEWALDSVEIADCIWLPREDQLRELLGQLLVRLERSDGTWRVITRIGADEHTVQDADVEQAYARTLLTALH